MVQSSGQVRDLLSLTASCASRLLLVGISNHAGLLKEHFRDVVAAAVCETVSFQAYDEGQVSCWLWLASALRCVALPLVS